MPQPAPPLFYPFEAEALEVPPRGARLLYMGARADVLPDASLGLSPTTVQGFRPDLLALQRVGFSPTAEPEGESYDLALVLASRHRGQNELWLAEAISRVRPGGTIMMAGAKSDGISSMRKRLAQEVPTLHHLAKNHGEVFWFQHSAEAEVYARQVHAPRESPPLIDGRYVTEPGMFSHDRIDAGSRLLADHLPSNLKGRAADFCAGWGYLSVEFAQRCPAIKSIDLCEADHASLEAARRNMASLAPVVPAAFHWLDLGVEPAPGRYDVILMNPPFHQGRAAEPGIGQALIRAAAKALHPGGQLIMVANHGLPYEAALKAAFRHAEITTRDAGFVVWTARR